jgi:hypothetical protein
MFVEELLDRGSAVSPVFAFRRRFSQVSLPLFVLNADPAGTQSSKALTYKDKYLIPDCTRSSRKRQDA